MISERFKAQLIKGCEDSAVTNFLDTSYRNTVVPMVRSFFADQMETCSFFWVNVQI